MKKTGLLLLCIVAIRPAFSQVPMPGGVVGAKIWYASFHQNSENIVWKNILLSSASHITGFFPDNAKSRLFNYNPALYVNGVYNGFYVSAGQVDLSRTTIFTVYDPEDAYWEKAIWAYSLNANDKLVLTTHRVGDLEDSTYMNFVPERIDMPRMNTYSHYKNGNTTEASLKQFRFGRQSETSSLPITEFKGLVPEFIVFDRVLSTEERMKVESYLALKYGITLLHHGPANYVNSKGETIWNGKENSPYFLNIAGIGRDDASGLYQKQSTSSYASELLTIGAKFIAVNNNENHTEFPDGNFLIWGDNNNELIIQKELQGQPRLLSRKWMIALHGNLNEIPTTISFGKDQIKVQKQAKERYWLIIDRSGTGNFPLGSVSYYPLTENLINDVPVISTNNIHWDTDSSGKDIFTLGIGPEMMATAWLTAPMCIPPANGIANIGAVGGLPPYHFSLSSSDANFDRQWTINNNETTEIDNISPGNYLLTVRDATGLTYQETLTIQSLDAPKSNLSSNYTIRPNEVLKLIVGNQDVVCYWTLPDGNILHHNEIAIKIPGIYSLEMNQNGCISTQIITVNLLEDVFFESVKLFPNPVSKNGFFNIAIELKKKGSVELLIYDTQTRLIQRKKLNAAVRHFYTGLIETSGLYTIVVKSADETQTLQLVVE